MEELFTTGSDGAYLPALTGNGELVTCLGPSGYHEDGRWHPGFCVFVLAGRRLRGSVPGLVRLGRLGRSVVVDGEASEPRSWRQQVVPTEGVVRSVLTHPDLEERTVTFVSLRENAFVGLTEICNTSGRVLSVSFAFRYNLGDWEGALPPGAVVRSERAGSGADLFYEIDGHLGLAALRPLGRPEIFADDERTVRFVYRLEIPPGGSERVGILCGFGDRRRYYRPPEEWEPAEWLQLQREAWGGFWAGSDLHVGDGKVEAARRISLYCLRCNASPWSIPPAYIPTHWEGRTFHDELYPFMGLISGGWRDLAGRIPRFRLRTLPQAEAWGSGPGARYPWETLEDGTEGGPFGPWMDEHFHIGQIAETAWAYLQYQDEPELLAEFFPMLAACADYFLFNIVRWEGSEAHVRPCTDYDEAVSPVPDGLYTLSAAIRSMEVAAKAARLLGVGARRAEGWIAAAAALRRSLPLRADGAAYATFAGAEHHHIAELGPVYPFCIADDVSLARRTLERFADACKADVGWKPGTLPGYDGTIWMWSGAHLATCWSFLGEGAAAWDAMRETVESAGPGLMPVEHINPDGTVGVPWFTTAAGAYVFALHSLFVRVTEGGTQLFPAASAALDGASFEGLAGKGAGVRVSAGLAGGKIRRMRVEAPGRASWRFTLASSLIPEGFLSWDRVYHVEHAGDLAAITLRLEGGSAEWERTR